MFNSFTFYFLREKYVQEANTTMQLLHALDGELMKNKLGENFLQFFFSSFYFWFLFCFVFFFLLGELFAVSSYIQALRHKHLRIGSFKVKTSIQKTVNTICFLKKKQTSLLLAERRKTRKNINLKKILNSGLQTFHSSVSVTLLWNGTQPSLRDTYSLKRFLRDLHRKMTLEIYDSVTGHLSIDYTY